MTSEPTKTTKTRARRAVKATAPPARGGGAPVYATRAISIAADPEDPDGARLVFAAGDLIPEDLAGRFKPGEVTSSRGSIRREPPTTGETNESGVVRAVACFYTTDPESGDQLVFVPGDVVPARIVAKVGDHVLDTITKIDPNADLGLDPKQHTGVPTVEHLEARRARYATLRRLRDHDLNFRPKRRTRVPEAIADLLGEFTALAAQRAAVIAATDRAVAQLDGIRDRNRQALKDHEAAVSEAVLYGREFPTAPKLEEWRGPGAAHDPTLVSADAETWRRKGNPWMYVESQMDRIHVLLEATELGLLEERASDLSEALDKRYARALKKRSKAHQMLTEAEQELQPHAEAGGVLAGLRRDDTERSRRDDGPTVTVNGESITRSTAWERALSTDLSKEPRRYVDQRPTGSSESPLRLDPFSGRGR